MNINIEKIRDDGVKLDIRIWLDDKGQFLITDLGLKPKGKRKYTYLCGSSMTDDYSYRSLNMEDRRKYKETLILNECSKLILAEALNDAWLKIEPTDISIW